LLKAYIAILILPSFRRGVRVGENIFVYGFPLAGVLAKSGNFTAGNITANAGLRDDIRSLQISAPLQPGSSGGPLLDQSGNIVGIVVAKLNLAQSVNFAIKSSIAIDSLDAHRVTVQTLANAQPRSPPDIAELASAFTVYIVCNRDGENWEGTIEEHGNKHRLSAARTPRSRSAHRGDR
jgi:hypothetical protein